MRGARGLATKFAALAVYIIIVLVATPQAQQPVSFTGSPGAISAGPAAAAPDATDIDLLVGRSTIVNVGSNISRVSLTVPDIADAMVTTPQQLLIHGKQPGTISLFVWDRAGGIKTYEVTVRRDLSRLIEQMKQLFPGEPIAVTGSGKDVVISGTVSSKYVVDKAAAVATGYVDKPEDVVNLLKQQEGVASNQVMLRVRFAEVSRSAMQELGASFVLDQFKSDWSARSTTQQFPAPDFDDSKPGRLTFSDYLNLFLFNSKHGVGAVVRALQTKGLFQSLAEPNLIALNGKEASFLAGGEYPYPVVQPGANGASVSIQFKEFGVRLSFTPTVLGNGLIDIKLRPEVSTLDFSNAITIDGFRLPALSTRRTETEVELQDGQTFAVAGLMNNTVNSSMQKIPGIGDIPILGYLFRSRAYQKNQTELVVMVTPTVMRTGSTGVSAGLPAPMEPYLGKPEKSLPNPDPYVGSPRYPGGTSSQGGSAQAPAAQPVTPVPQPAAPLTSAPVRVPVRQPMPLPVATSPNTMRAPAPAPQRTAAPVAQASAPAQHTTAPAPASAHRTTPPTTAASRPASQTASAKKTAPQPKPLTKEQQKRLARAREAEKKAQEVAAREKAEQARKQAEARKVEEERKAEQARKEAEAKRIADKKADQERARQQKLDEERAKREAEVARKNAELDREKADAQKKREKALADAAERLRQAQAAYQAELDKSGSKGGSDAKKSDAKDSGGSPASTVG